MVQQLRRKKRRRPPDLLTSIENLLDEIDQRLDAKLHRILSSHVFVGYIDRQFALVQHNTKLYLVNYHVLRSQRHTLRFILADIYQHTITSDAIYIPTRLQNFQIWAFMHQFKSVHANLFLARSFSTSKASARSLNSTKLSCNLQLT